MSQDKYVQRVEKNFERLTERMLKEGITPSEFPSKLEEEISSNIEYLGDNIREKPRSQSVIDIYTTWLMMEDILPDVIDDLSNKYDASFQDLLPEVHNTAMYIVFMQEHLRTLDPQHKLLGMISIDDGIRMEKSYMDKYGSFENLPLYCRHLQKAIDHLETF